MKLNPLFRAVSLWCLAVAGLSCATDFTGECTPQNCPGCCTIEGVCRVGWENDACGLGGGACRSCSGGLETCASGLCIWMGPAADAGSNPDGGSNSDGGSHDGGADPDGGCIPSCSGRQCGTDGCGGTCGACDAGTTCDGIACLPCAPLCIGRECGDDGCNGSCGGCTSGLYCDPTGHCAGCVPTTCAAQGKNCGNIPDGCGNTLVCGSGSCSSPQTCGGGGTPNVCGCTPTTCAAQGNDCGTIGNGCGGTLSCGVCYSPQTCGGGGTPNVCGCSPTSCAAQGKDCGTIGNGCGGTLSCGACYSPQTCGGGGTPNVCGCIPTSCAAQGKSCGTISNGCGGSLNCGVCSSPQSCGGGGTPGVCGCTPTTCAAQGKSCGTMSNGCGSTLNCGVCSSPQTCGGGGTPGVCGGGRLSFTASWQALPMSPLIEFRCVGMISSTGSGTSCERTAGDPVQLRIGGYTYVAYPGCDGARDTNCMTTIYPSGAVYKDYSYSTSAMRLLCEAMGWTRSSTQADKNPGTVDRAVAVVQVGSTVYGWNPGLKNYGTYVYCAL